MGDTRPCHSSDEDDDAYRWWWWSWCCWYWNWYCSYDDEDDDAYRWHYYYYYYYYGGGGGGGGEMPLSPTPSSPHPLWLVSLSSSMPSTLLHLVFPPSPPFSLGRARAVSAWGPFVHADPTDDRERKGFSLAALDLPLPLPPPPPLPLAHWLPLFASFDGRQGTPKRRKRKKKTTHPPDSRLGYCPHHPPPLAAAGVSHFPRLGTIAEKKNSMGRATPMFGDGGGKQAKAKAEGVGEEE